jgi:LmbE family N-acetylglucosaminyl deacetylase
MESEKSSQIKEKLVKIEELGKYLPSLNKPEDYLFKYEPNNSDSLKIILKEELHNGKEDLEYLKKQHPFFSNKENENFIKENYKKEKLVLNLTKEDKVMLFSPHPDDEILGGCRLLHFCYENDINIKCVYMTSGSGAGVTSVRQQESQKGIQKIGGNLDSLIFTDFPFYLTKERKISEKDEDYAREIINEHKPSHIFICADCFDPNRTHLKCYQILMNILYPKKEEFKDISVFFYYSVWYWPNEFEYSHYLPYNFSVYKKKVYAMLEHESQLVNQFMGNDPRPFYQRSMGRDTEFGKQHGCEYCEIFYKLI